MAGSKLTVSRNVKKVETRRTWKRWRRFCCWPRSCTAASSRCGTSCTAAPSWRRGCQGRVRSAVTPTATTATSSVTPATMTTVARGRRDRSASLRCERCQGFLDRDGLWPGWKQRSSIILGDEELLKGYFENSIRVCIAPQSLMRCSGWKQTCSRSHPVGMSVLKLTRKWAQLTTTSRCCQVWFKPVNYVARKQT